MSDPTLDPPAAPAAGGSGWPARLGPVVLLAFACAVFVYAQGGNRGKLYHDDAIFFYGGQEMVRGRPVYLGIFDHKGPLGQMFCGLGVWLSRVIGKDDLITTRYLFLGVASATAAGVCALAGTLFRSRMVGFLSSTVFVSFWGYGAFAFGGTRPKMLMAMFEVAALLALAHRRWFLAGTMATLAAFTWQPAGVLFLVGLALAWLQSSRAERVGAVLRSVAGAVLPAALLAGYFVAAGAFSAFLDGCFLFNLRYLEDTATLADRAGSLMQTLVYNGMGIPTLFGLCLIPVLYAWRIRQRGLRALHADPFACILFSFPFPVLWSLQDFQQYPDFFVFLPYVALSIGWMLHAGATGLGERMALLGRARAAWTALPGVVLVLFSGQVMRYIGNEGLAKQWSWARELRAEYPDARVAAIGHPEVHAVLREPNVTRFGFLMRGIPEYIEANEPGGFEGWLRSISDSGADVLIVKDDYAARLGSFAAAWDAWLAGYERRPEKIGDWSVYLPRAE